MLTMTQPLVEVNLTFQRYTHNEVVAKFKNQPEKEAIRNFSEIYAPEQPYVVIAKSTTPSGWESYTAHGFPSLASAQIATELYSESDNSSVYNPTTGEMERVGNDWELIGIADSGTVPAAPGELITVYYRTSMMGSIVKQEGRLLKIGRKPYAQYPNAPFLEYVPKRKRTGLRLVQSFQPYMLVLKGHGHPSPTELFGISLGSFQPGVETKTTTHNTFSGDWVKDFEAKINPYLAAQKENIVLGDFREWLG